jgi:PDZ domain-containing secreted protein
VGGVAQKTAAVRKAQADVFVVPSEEYDEAVAHAGSKLKIVRADTLEQALAALQELGGEPVDRGGAAAAA